MRWIEKVDRIDYSVCISRKEKVAMADGMESL
jgi:hypothetical protein